MYESFETDLKLFHPNQFCEIAYEELTGNPLATLEKIYQSLQLEEFETVQPVLEQFAATQKSYQKNKFNLSTEMKEQIANRWQHYFERYGYEK
jgi:LPS sulfotransferase NodH